MDAIAYEQAAARVRGHVRRTPLVPAAPSGERRNLWFKPECLQISGSFKARGAFNSVLSIPQEKRANGVVTASGGNFGAAIAYAARELGIPASVVVMEGSTELARDRIRSFGAELHVIGEFWDLSWEAGKEIAAKTGGTLLHANGHHMAVAAEPFLPAAARIEAAGGGPVTMRRRLPALAGA